MMTRTLSRWLISIALSVLALFAINVLVATSPVQGRPAAALINCAGSIQACIDAANDGDTILIAAGRYTESLTLSKPVSLTGENRDTTIIHAVEGQRVLTATGAIIDNSVVISGLTFTGGDVTNGPACPTSCGGGIALLDMAQPRVSSLIIQHNQASYGGGLFVEPDSLLLIYHSQLISNTAYQGGGIYAGDWYTPSSLAVTNTVFLSNSATDGGGIFINGFASMADVHFENNTVIAMGGGLYARGGVITATRAAFINNSGTAFYTYDSPATIIDSHFERNSGGVGGGLWAYYVGANISDTDFISNTADLGGGGATMIDGSIVNSRFEGNTAQEDWGGGLYAMGTSFVTNTVFINNVAQTNGGGAYFGNAEIYDSRFEGNTGVTGDGGGFFAYGTLISNTDLIGNRAGCTPNTDGCGGGGAYTFNEATVINSRFEDNTTVGNGNGGGLNANSTLTVTHSVFISNTANNYGGGLYISGIATISDTDFISNMAQSGGAGAFVQTAAYITDSRFEGNVSNSQQYAGGIFAHTLWITNTTFIGNSSLHAGGAQAGYAYINGGRFEQNISQGFGGGLAINDLFMTGTVVINNTAGGGGGAWVPHTAWLNGVRFENNRALGDDPRWTNGGGLLVEHGSLFMSDTQFISNSAVTFGGGLSLSSDVPGRVVNTVFAGNHADAGGTAIATTAGGDLDLLHTTIADSVLNPQPAIAVLSGTLHITNTIIANHAIGISNTGGIVYEDYNLFFNNITNTIGVTSGGHGLIGDPKFVDPINGNYHLQFGSAAIDRGVDAEVYVDLDGQLRPVGAGFDIGAYEYQAIKVLYLPVIYRH